MSELVSKFRRVISNRKLAIQMLKFSDRHKRQLVGRNTELLVEGAPGSGNSFVFHAIEEAHPNLNIAGHLHLSAQVKVAAELHIPTLVLYRHPIDSVVSICSREPSPDCLRRRLYDYTNFYRNVISLKSSYLLVHFNEAVSDLPAVIESLNQKFGTRINKPSGEILNKNKPAEKQLSLKEELRTKIDTNRELSSLVEQADATYSQLSSISPTAQTTDVSS